MSGTKILWSQLIVVGLIVLTSVWCATQWTAWRLGFQPQLGTPWLDLVGWPIYHPPAFFWWWFSYDAYARSIFNEGAIIAASGGFFSIAAAILMSVLRAREADNVATYGSARWATAAEVKGAGLLGPDGVVLGRLERDYLRHDGPEHVLCFAPTRSGKGVGLVVPSLLTWPGSAIVHDIKGENWQLTAGFRAQHGRVSFATNDERTAKRVSDALGTATEMRSMKNYAGHRLSPWLGHLMVSRQESARALLTPGEVMQLPPSDEIVMVAGIQPIRARKARYYEDVRLTERIVPPPGIPHIDRLPADDWSMCAVPQRPVLEARDLPIVLTGDDEDSTESEKRRQPELSRSTPAQIDPTTEGEFDADRDADQDPAVLARNLNRTMRRIARQADLDPSDGML